MKNKSNKKTAIVTGVHGGIGGRLAKKLTENGIYCIMVDIHGGPSPDLVNIIDQNNGEYFSADLTDSNQIDRLVSAIWEREKIDYLYNVAGIGVYKSIDDLSLDEWNRSVSLNLTAPFYLTKKVIDLLRKSEAPLVFNVGSGMGVLPSSKRVSYVASKFGLRGLTLSLAKEFENDKIKFQLLTLGSVMTDFGTGGISHRESLQKTGKKYLHPDTVAEKIYELTLDRLSPTEIVFYPDGYEEVNK